MKRVGGDGFAFGLESGFGAMWIEEAEFGVQMGD